MKWKDKLVRIAKTNRVAKIIENNDFIISTVGKF
jgi:hypothetical protein